MQLKQFENRTLCQPYDSYHQLLDLFMWSLRLTKSKTAGTGRVELLSSCCLKGWISLVIIMFCCVEIGRGHSNPSQPFAAAQRLQCRIQSSFWSCCCTATPWPVEAQAENLMSWKHRLYSDCNKPAMTPAFPFSSSFSHWSWKISKSLLALVQA